MTGAAAEAVQDMVQLERLVGRLAGGGYASHAGPAAALRVGAGSLMAPVMYASVPLGIAQQSPAKAVEVLTQMMQNIAQDARLLAPVQVAVERLRQPLTQLVQIDTLFFSDDRHPARRLLDELTQRSLSFADESEPGFSGFMQLTTQAADHLCVAQIKDASPFELVLKALQPAWDIQSQKVAARREAERQARLHAERRAVRVHQIATDIRRLPDLEQVPADIVDFVAGPWSEVLAQAQEQASADANDPQNDRRGYWALIPVLFWSAQPELTCQAPAKLTEIIPGLLGTLQEGLQSVDYPSTQAAAFVHRLSDLHQMAFEKAASESAAPSEHFAQDLGHVELPLEAMVQPSGISAAVPPFASQPVSDFSQTPVAPDEPPPPFDPHADFKIGVWVDLITSGREVHTQLTWASPNGTLFLFTAPDASTQSMTRRMRDRLVADGSLRVVPLKTAPMRSRPMR